MQKNENEEDEIFYEARETMNSPLKLKNTSSFNFDIAQGKDTGEAVKSSSFNRNSTFYFEATNTKSDFARSSFRRETVYEDAIDLDDKDNAENKEQGQVNPFTLVMTKTCDSLASKTVEFDELRDQERKRKTSLLDEDLKSVNLDLEFLKKNYKTINVKTKGIKDKHIQNLIELQCFQGDSQQIWAAKISYDGKYIATGGKSGVLKIWGIFSEDESLDNYESQAFNAYFQFINENAFRIYTEHTQDIIDICWSPRVNILYIKLNSKIIFYLQLPWTIM